MYKGNKQLEDCDDDEKIFRYMDFISFYSLLRNQNIFFKRIDKYTDRLEGLVHEQTITNHIKWLLMKDPYMPDAEAKRRAEADAAHIKNYREWTLSNSWNLGKDESYAMWKIYLRGSTEGVAIQTTVGKLKAQLEKNTKFEFTSGKVTYEPLNYGTVGQFSVSANKRPPYAYENEYRALVINQHDVHKKPLFDFGSAVDIIPSELIEKVYISPFATGWFETMVRQLITDKLPYFNPDHIVWSKIQDS